MATPARPRSVPMAYTWLIPVTRTRSGQARARPSGTIVPAVGGGGATPVVANGVLYPPNGIGIYNGSRFNAATGALLGFYVADNHPEGYFLQSKILRGISLASNTALLELCRGQPARHLTHCDQFRRELLCLCGIVGRKPLRGGCGNWCAAMDRERRGSHTQRIGLGCADADLRAFRGKWIAGGPRGQYVDGIHVVHRRQPAGPAMTVNEALLRPRRASS